ncbi:hypothetical protein BC830DRAFT_1111361 [Chytriomyces sp. MP71]|nr:hypothetical protein BC830DRAFT_1111361 [Chytriomyces sp. MP71]
MGPQEVGAVLGDPTFTASIGGFFLFQILFYTALARCFPITFLSEKARAWILTGLNSLVSVLVSLPFWASFLARLDLSLPQKGFQEWTTAIRVFCGFFMSYLLGDLVLGSLLYRSQMGPSTGYFHHFLYLLLIPIALVYDLGGNFALMSFLELPTLVMAVAQVHKPLRNDALFGALYFLTRIMLHLVIVEQFVVGYPGKWLVLFPVLLLPLHIYWFLEWVQQQVRIRREKQDAEDAVGVQVVVDLQSVTGKNDASTALPDEQ